MCRAICRTCVESSPAGGPSSHPTPGRGAGVPCTPQANAARPAAAYLCYHAAVGRGVHRRPPAGAVRVVPLNRFCGRGPGRPRRRVAGPPKPGRGGAIRDRSRPAGAAGQPGPGQCGGKESSRGGGPSPGLWARRAGGSGKGGLELPTARSLRISGPEDKKFRSRSGGGCREAGPRVTAKQDRGGFRQQGPGPVPPAGTGAASASRDRAGSGQQEGGGGFRHKEQRQVPAQKNRGRFRRTQPGRSRPARNAGRFRRQEQARRTRPPGPDRLKSSNG
jgi:hypothetical protein